MGSRQLHVRMKIGQSGYALRCCRRPQPWLCYGANARAADPLHRTSVSPQVPSGTLSFQRRVFAGNPHHRRGFPAPPKSIMSTIFAQHALSTIQRADVRFLGGVPKAEITARIMRGSEKPAAKRPRSYMEGPCGRKLSIMSTVLPNTPLKNPKKRC